MFTTDTLLIKIIQHNIVILGNTYNEWSYEQLNKNIICYLFLCLKALIQMRHSE